MSLAVAFKGPEGIVLAADSRVTLSATLQNEEKISVYFDNATKLLSVQGQNFVGIVTYGIGAIGQTEPRTAHGYIPEFEAHLTSVQSDRLPVKEIACELGKFYLQQWQQAGMPMEDPNIPPMVFFVAGFDELDAYGKVYQLSIPTAPHPVEQNENTFGLTWGGQGEFVQRLIGGVDAQALALAKEHLALDDEQTVSLARKWQENRGLSIPYQFLPLQDCVDLSTFLVNMTSAVQTWTVAIRGVGGAVDVATITRTDGFRALQQKRIQVWE